MSTKVLIQFKRYRHLFPKIVETENGTVCSIEKYLEVGLEAGIEKKVLMNQLSIWNVQYALQTNGSNED